MRARPDLRAGSSLFRGRFSARTVTGTGGAGATTGTIFGRASGPSRTTSSPRSRRPTDPRPLGERAGLEQALVGGRQEGAVRGQRQVVDGGRELDAAGGRGTRGVPGQGRGRLVLRNGGREEAVARAVRGDLVARRRGRRLREPFAVQAEDVQAGRRGLDEHQRSEEHTSELQSRENLVCRLLLEKKKY